jgi:hypothetical protein
MDPVTSVKLKRIVRVLYQSRHASGSTWFRLWWKAKHTDRLSWFSSVCPGECWYCTSYPISTTSFSSHTSLIIFSILLSISQVRRIDASLQWLTSRLPLRCSRTASGEFDRLTFIKYVLRNSIGILYFLSQNEYIFSQIITFMLFMSMGWDFVSELWPLTASCSSPRWYMSVESHGEMKLMVSQLLNKLPAFCVYWIFIIGFVRAHSLTKS